MKQAIIKIEYPGAVISVNHYKINGRYTKRECKDWADKLGWLFKMKHFEDWELPLEVTCNGFFKDERSAPDLSNLSKVILDELAGVTNINDKHFRWNDGIRDVGHVLDPYLLLVISETTDKVAPLFAGRRTGMTLSSSESMIPRTPKK